MKKFKIKSFCKINLSLRVSKKLKGDYHDISSLITFCDPYDVITISKMKKKANDKIIFYGRFKRGINKKSNTVTKAMYLLRKKNFFKNQFFKINIQKNIPHGSGLGGGSSNAADLLNFFKLKMHLNLNKSEIKKIAKQIGFDVPINLNRQNIFLTGKKDEILRLRKKFKLNILIVYPNVVCSTKKIYSANKKFTFFEKKVYFDIKNKDQLINFLKKEKNDLETTVIRFYPNVKKVIDFIKVQSGCYFSRITGSGSACIGIFSNVKAAVFAQKLIKIKFPKYWSVVSKTI